MHTWPSSLGCTIFVSQFKLKFLQFLHSYAYFCMFRHRISLHTCLVVILSRNLIQHNIKASNTLLLNSQVLLSLQSMIKYIYAHGVVEGWKMRGFIEWLFFSLLVIIKYFPSILLTSVLTRTKYTRMYSWFFFSLRIYVNRPVISWMQIRYSCFALSIDLVVST